MKNNTDNKGAKSWL